MCPTNLDKMLEKYLIPSMVTVPANISDYRGGCVVL